MKGRRKKTYPVKEESFTVIEVGIEDVETVCQVCNAEFLDEEDLQLHIAQVHLDESNGKIICKVCCTIVPGADAFVTHFIFNHLENASFCFYCYRAFFDPLLFAQHELKHCPVADNSAISCSNCSTIFGSRHELQNHEFEEHRNSGNSYMLNNFFSLLSSALNIKINNFIDCVYKKNPLICHKCNYSSLCIKDFIKHLKNFNCQSLACDKCFNVYKKKFSIIKHMQKKLQCHNYVIEKQVKKQCPKCDKYFDPKDINNHKKFCNIIKCFTCKKVFDSIYDLTDHRNEEHKVSVSLRTCKFCKKQFVGTLNLTKHMRRSHRNQSLYKYNCIYCGSLFTHPRKLFAHFFTQHKDIEPYNCKICDKYFKLRKKFTIHIKLHHKSIGFVEFDKNLHVIFTDKKSINPVEPQVSVDVEDSINASDSDSNNIYLITKSNSNVEQAEQTGKEDMSLEIDIIQSTTSSINYNDSNDMNVLNVQSDFISDHEIQVEVDPVDTRSGKARQKRNCVVESLQTKIDSVNNLNQLSDESDEEPLSNIKQSLLQEKSQNSPNLKRRLVIRDKRAKLTCKICNKYCYTVQNYHHHLSLHEKTKLKRCIKCHEYFKSRQELKNHINNSHSSSKLTETLKSVLEKRKKIQPGQSSHVKPGELLKSLLEQRKKQRLMTAMNSPTNKFRRTIKKVNCVDDCTATVTPMSDHGLSVKNFIENFRPEIENVNISNSVTIKAVSASINKEPLIKMRKFNSESPERTCTRILSFPVKFKDPPDDYMNTKVNVKLVQQLITKPKLVNMTYDERIPVVEETSEPDEYCNTFADETDYTQYKNEAIPEVAQEVMLGDPEDIPRTKRLAREIIIPKIPEEYGGVRIGHLLPQAPFYKIVKVKKLLEAANETNTEEAREISDKDVKLPDGTRLISVKNPYSHLIPNEHLEEVLKANRTKYYTPKAKNIGKAIAKALSQIKPPKERKGRKSTKKKSFTV